MQAHLLYQISQIRQLEQSAKTALAPGNLMQAAGAAAAKLAAQLIDEAHAKSPRLSNIDSHRAICILAGPGDNGGDAFEVAYQLARLDQANQLQIHVLVCGSIEDYSDDAKLSLHRAKSRNCRWLQLDEIQKFDPKQYILIVDGLFGIGLNRPITGEIASLIEAINKQVHQISQCPVLALDVPSGLNANTGQIIGSGAVGIALIASHTITFIGNKPGLHTAQGKDYAGVVRVDDLGVEKHLYPAPYARLSTRAELSTLVKPRKQDSNKGSYGDVIVVGGGAGMQGAPLLAGRAALYTGAGRVHVEFVEAFSGIDFSHPELMCRLAESSDFSAKNLVIGPGLGDSQKAIAILRLGLVQTPTIVIDADALNLLSKHADLAQLCRDRSLQSWHTIITPHPLEAARLLNCSATDVQNDRCQAAQTLAKKFQATVVLKGAGSVIADQEHITINSSGNPALATAGTGDVLAGVCGTLLAQGLNALDVARLATFIHGLAADDCVKNGLGPIGLSASEIIPAIRTALNQLVYPNHN
ncbi:NAD(P)H-hydrate dehydratase [Undibacterium sp. Di24W]|uniref:NAD(P)H-hydrate dehydratase n=1 Tax=Undibacterium sp. Di24W TaxID=3413033 RepID=UPI003BF294C6